MSQFTSSMMRMLAALVVAMGMGWTLAGAASAAPVTTSALAAPQASVAGAVVVQAQYRYRRVYRRPVRVYRRPVYYRPARVYRRPAYYRPVRVVRCRIVYRRVWNGYRWVNRRVRVCR